ncbi:MAG TPA: hypothetical protein VLT58_08530, partial [Polyangia bacterium]|nr:hypothetical protein [Polyangia bacterium]
IWRRCRRPSKLRCAPRFNAAAWADVVIAYKFLARGARGPITSWPWSVPTGGVPGRWVEAAGPVAVCRSGVHACRPRELAYWIHEELWRVELDPGSPDGEWIEGPDCVVARRARLLQRVDAWSEAGGAQRFAVAVRDHAAAQIASHPARAHLQGYVDDASWHVANGIDDSPALAALCAAMAVAQAGVSTDPGEELEPAYRRERAWQSNWIATEMGLT